MGTYPIRKVSEEVEKIINQHKVAAIEIVGMRNEGHHPEYYYEVYFAAKPAWHGAIVIFTMPCDGTFVPVVAECKHVIDAIAVMYSFVEEEFGARNYKIVEINVKEAQII
jgi:hypothetical protein